MDTDAANYFDDQFALAYAALSPEALQIEAVYAAPFSNQRVSSPDKAMKQSQHAIELVLETLQRGEEIPVLRGSSAWLNPTDHLNRSAASEDIASRVLRADDPVEYVVSLGAPTTVAAAILLEPEIAKRATVVWLGGTPHHFASASEFNLRQDPRAARVLFDSGVGLMHVPALGVAENIRTTLPEIDDRLRGNSAIGTYLANLVALFSGGSRSSGTASKTLALWDVAPIAWLVNPRWVESIQTASPVLSESLTWSASPNSHPIRVATRVLRDEIITDMLDKLAG